jgi:hypothetical protein
MSWAIPTNPATTELAERAIMSARTSSPSVARALASARRA